MEQVFVYGTLLSGEYNNRLLATSEKMGKEVVSGFTMVSLGAYPACIPDENATTPILGEVWRVDDETFQRLDRLEGYPHFYDRKEVDTFAGKAWIYCMHEENMRDNLEVIISGNWKQFLGKDS
jgi:gamma-glutamylcyclotransferase (GGCT)/AIG2-like uncharacterized protein YtfP